jgi:hypothetical protein
MEHEKKTQHVGYAYVINQNMDKVYQPKKALAEGTIFPELNILSGEYERRKNNGK